MFFPSFAQARRVQDNKARYIDEFGRPKDWQSAERHVSELQQQMPEKSPEDAVQAPLATPKLNPDGSMDAVAAAGMGGHSKWDPRMQMLKKAEQGAAAKELSRSAPAGRAVSSAEARQIERGPLFESQARRKRLQAKFPGVGSSFAMPSVQTAR